MYNNEYDFYIYLEKIEELLNSILKIINKINIINNDNYNINKHINFDQLILLIDKIIYRLYQTNIDKIYKINFNLIDFIEVFNSRSTIKNNKKSFDLAKKLSKKKQNYFQNNFKLEKILGKIKPVNFKGLSIDTRIIKKNNLFLGIKGNLSVLKFI